MGTPLAIQSLVESSSGDDISIRETIGQSLAFVYVACRMPLSAFMERTQRQAAAVQVLRLLSQAYLLSGQAAHAVACVQSARKLQDPPDDAPNLRLTAIDALIQVRLCL